MANNMTSNPWVIDTAGTLTDNPTRVTKMRWHPNAADNDLVVAHADGHIVWPIQAIAASSSFESVGCEEVNFTPAFPFAGIKIETLDAGKLYIFIDTVF